MYMYVRTYTYQIMYVCVCLCVCMCILNCVSKLDTDQFEVTFTLLTCKEEELNSNKFINTNKE
jgi:hypothetical protein